MYSYGCTVGKLCIGWEPVEVKFGFAHEGQEETAQEQGHRRSQS